MTFIKRFMFIILVLITILSGCGNSSDSDSSPSPAVPDNNVSSDTNINVLILVLDAFRADMSSLYGYDKQTTPHLEEWAKKGTTFTRAYSQSTTTNTSAWSYHTGQYPYFTDYLNPVRDTDTPIAEIMLASGFETASFSDNPYISKKMGFHRGFETFDNRLFKNTPIPFPKNEKNMKKRMDILAKNYPRTGDTSKDLLDEAQSWILKQQDSPWFCYAHILRPHNPYHSPEPFLSQFLDVEVVVPDGDDPFRSIHLQETLTFIQDANSDKRPDPARLKMLINLYEGSIAYSDHLTNEFLTALDNAGALDNTMVIIMSDHGEAFEEHGKFLHGRTYPYQEQVHVPLIVLPPSNFPETVQQSDTPVGLIDLVPTLQDVLGLDIHHELDGQSLKPLMMGNASSFRDYTYFQNVNPASIGVLQNDQTVITHLTPDYGTVVSRLAFDLSSDPGEQNDIYQENGEFGDYLELTSRYVKSRVNNISILDVEFTTEEKDLLESLGYIQ